MTSTIFDVTSDDIARLEADQLREMVAKLAQAVMQAKGYSSTCLTWGGNMTAPDGGYDAYAELPQGAGYCAPGLPRHITGYQSKKNDLAKGAMAGEMWPNGNSRQVLVELARQGGAYIIASSGANASHAMLESRRKAMRAQMDLYPNGASVLVDFFDRNRLKDWVNEYPGLVPWVRERAGRTLDGWKSFGNWSYPGQVGESAYIADARARIHLGAAEAVDISPIAAIHKLREMLSAPGSAVRLVGLSGVGKTRFAQALFEKDLGINPLAEALAIYADVGRSLNPDPVAMVTNLIATKRQAVLVVDNCSAKLHREIADACQQLGTTVSLLSIEYDVREDFSAETEVVTIAAASDDLISELLLRRYSVLSREDRAVITGASGGNARIAIAIAGTVKQTGELGRLADPALFERLFWQRDTSNADQDLLKAAMAASLVYSFNVENSGTDEPLLLPRIAALASQQTDETFGHIATLEERQLVQERGVWRAVLPHALANYLADRAMNHIPVASILAQLVKPGERHVQRSFVRRLSYLPNNPRVKLLCTDWLSPGGMLNSPLGSDQFVWDMFENAATVVPVAALEAIERCPDSSELAAFAFSRRLAVLLRYIGYEASVFDRVVTQLLRMASQDKDSAQSPESYKVLLSFFSPIGAGTLAPRAQRFAHVRTWLADDDSYVRQLGCSALGQLLGNKAQYYHQSLGVQRRDGGKGVSGELEYADWVRDGLAIMLAQSAHGGGRADGVHRILAASFPNLWMVRSLRSDLDSAMVAAASGQFWLDGWKATIEARRVCHDDAALLAELKDLEDKLAPLGLADRVVAFMFRPRRTFNKNSGMTLEQWHAQEPTESRKLGELVAAQPDLLPDLLPRLAGPSERAEYFGEGLAAASTSLETTWKELVQGWKATPVTRRYSAVMRGFILLAAQRDRPAVNAWLDAAVMDVDLAIVVPVLTARINLDLAGISRIAKVLALDEVPLQSFDCLGAVPWLEADIKAAAIELVEQIVRREHGAAVVSSIVSGWLGNTYQIEGQSKDQFAPVCRIVLAAVHWREIDDNSDYALGMIAQVGLAGPAGVAVAQVLARNLREDAERRYGIYEQKPELFKAMLEAQPGAVLSALFDGADDSDAFAVESTFRELTDYPHMPKDLVDTEALMHWCAAGPNERYAFAARIVPVAVEDGSGKRVLSEPARRILEASPEPAKALDHLATRIAPRQAVGSRDLVSAANAAALFDAAAHLRDAAFQEHASQLREQFESIEMKGMNEQRRLRKAINDRFE
jgi:hypothetical protein